MKFSNREVGAKVVVAVKGSDLDSSVASDLKNHLIETLEQNPNSIIVIDLAKVKFIDSSCLGALLAAYRQTGSNRKVVVAEAQEQVRNVFKIARLSKVMPMLETVNEAMELSMTNWPIPAKE